MRSRALTAALVLSALAGLAQAAEPSYTEDLAVLYNEYQRVLTLRDTCIAVQPDRKADLGGAYVEWLERHQRIVDDLDNRFAALVKRASKDQADYTKNYARHQSDVLQMREDNRKALLADKTKLAQQCADLPLYLRSSQSNIPTLLPAEFKRVYRTR